MLNPAEQRAYRLFLDAFRAGARAIDLVGLDPGTDWRRVIGVVLGDHPDIGYFDPSKFYGQRDWSGAVTSVRLAGVRNPKKEEQRRRELDAAAERAMSVIRSQASDEYDALVWLSCYLQRTVRYDFRTFERGESDGHSDPYRAYGALVEGLAVCSGIADAFCLLAQRMGYCCMVVRGKSRQRSEAVVEHAWNIVELNGHCAHVDVTWDLNHHAETGDCSFEYFMIDDEDIAHDHDWDVRFAPACARPELSYYARRGLCVASRASLERLIEEELARRSPIIRFKLTHHVPLPGPADDHLAELVRKTAAANGIPVSFKYSWNRFTRCFYARIEYKGG